MSNAAGSTEVWEAPSGVKIPKLSRNNYEIWKEEIEKYLRSEGLWGYVDETETKTPSSEDQTYLKNQAKVRRIIKRSCGAWLLPYIEGKSRASSVLSQLKTMFKNADETLLRPENVTNYTWWMPLYDAIRNGNLTRVEQFISKNNNVLTARLTSEGEIPLHVAVQYGQIEIVKKMVEMMEPKELESSDECSRTALHFAASVGNLNIVKVLVERHKDLVMLTSENDGNVPLTIAARLGQKDVGNKDVVYYLYPKTLQQDHLDCAPKEEKQKKMIKAGLLTSLIFGDFFDLAIDLIERNPDLVLMEDADKYTALGALSMKADAFPSSFAIANSSGFDTLRNHMKKAIYLFFNIDDEYDNTRLQTKGDVENSSNASQDNAQGGDRITIQLHKRLRLWFLKQFQRVLKLVPSFKAIHDTKAKHYCATKLLKNIWKQVSQIEDLGSVEDEAIKAMFRASELGIIEFVKEAIDNCPQFLLETFPCSNNEELSTRKKEEEPKSEGRTIFHYAINNRQGQIFNLIHDVGPRKNDIIKLADNSKNYMLHLAAKLSPKRRLIQVPGAALQMQHELLWYKEVEKIMPPTYGEFENNDGKTARTLFTEAHEDLVKDATTWMKETATQCMVVATLVTTIMFAAVFTVPGIKESGTGKPNYIHEKFSITFVSANILALNSSVASMLMFLAIITSRYSEEDFLNSLPRMMTIGLIFLFFSIVGMMIEFVVAVLVLVHYNVLWVSFPIVFLATVPITIYALMDFPLFIELAFASTRGKIFGVKKSSSLHGSSM